MPLILCSVLSHQSCTSNHSSVILLFFKECLLTGLYVIYQRNSYSTHQRIISLIHPSRSHSLSPLHFPHLSQPKTHTGISPHSLTPQSYSFDHVSPPPALHPHASLHHLIFLTSVFSLCPLPVISLRIFSLKVRHFTCIFASRI